MLKELIDSLQSIYDKYGDLPGCVSVNDTCYQPQAVVVLKSEEGNIYHLEVCDGIPQGEDLGVCLLQGLVKDEWQTLSIMDKREGAKVERWWKDWTNSVTASVMPLRLVYVRTYDVLAEHKADLQKPVMH